MSENVRVAGRRLGRLPNPPAKRAMALPLDRYVAPLPAAPSALDLTPGIPGWPMYANDRLGDCTCAAAGHMLEIWSYQVTGAARILQDSDIVALYESQGYNPADPRTDAGAAEMNVLDTWRKTGLAGDTLLAYASCDPSDQALVRTAAWLFSGLYIGIALPLSAQSQQTWDAVDGPLAEIEPGGWGGHAVNVVGYDGAGLTVITWGAPKRMTWAFWSTYVDEAWACIPSDYAALGSKPLANGFDFAQLQQDLLSVGAVDEGA